MLVTLRYSAGRRVSARAAKALCTVIVAEKLQPMGSPAVAEHELPALAADLRGLYAERAAQIDAAQHIGQRILIHVAEGAAPWQSRQEAANRMKFGLLFDPRFLDIMLFRNALDAILHARS